MIRLHLLLIVSLISISSNLSGQGTIDKGVLDLRYERIPDKTIELRGDWEFYWERHVLPADLKRNISLTPDLYMHVPSYWSDFKDQMPAIENTGYATYRLRILLPTSYNNELMLAIPVFDSSYRLYVNGKYINSNGVAGTSTETSMPEYQPFNYTFKAEKDTIDIIVNVSNFHHRKGGFWLSMKFGDSKVVGLDLQQKELFSTLTNGMLFAFAGFIFMFYMMFREDRSMLYFSLASVSILIRSIFTGTYSILYFFDINWRWLIKIEYISSFLALIFALWYFYYIYKDKFIPWINTAITAIFVLAIVIVLLFPVSMFSYTILVFTPATIIVLGYYLARSVIDAFRYKGYKIVIAFGFAVLMLGAINDILHSVGSELIADEYILTHTLIFFILMQVIVLLYRWVISSREENRLLGEIEYINKNLENIVIERTTELTNQKGEVERQKKVTDAKNLELEKTISVKNRIFSIIAHDLKSPVLNLSLMIDHLKNDNDPEVRNSVINSISQQSGFAINLIDNLLLWGEGQSNKITYNPGHINLTDLVLENFNLLRDPADRKMIKMTYSHKSNPVAICDKDLMDIVLRNTLSNAVKFTRRNGTISVSIEEPAVKDGMISIKVKDNGVGIEEEKLSRIFGDGIIDSTPGTDNEKGTGLGMQLCNDLVRINKGSISITSEVGRGTTITIMLPAPTKK